MLKLISNCQNVALSLLILLFASVSANATLLATWGTSDVLGTSAQNSASFEAAGITGSDLSSIYGPSSGYVPGYEWGIWGSNAAANEKFELTMSTASSTFIERFDFSMFNNDCQAGYGYQSWCSTASWAVSASINSGTFGPDLLVFNAGQPGVDPDFSVILNQSLNAGDSITMQIRGINPGSSWPGTGQYYIHDIAMIGVPEPAHIALLCLGLLGLRLRRKN